MRNIQTGILSKTDRGGCKKTRATRPFPRVLLWKSRDPSKLTILQTLQTLQSLQSQDPLTTGFFGN